jgi:alpha-beta hydrolase superfamily lysophospholipase
MHARSLRVLVTCAIGAIVPAAWGAAPDYARESRWAQEVAPQVVVGDVVWLTLPDRPRVLALFTEPVQPAKGAVIVVHGQGVHPDWNLIGALRTDLAERGYATLAVQMPVLAADAPRDDYADLYADAGDRLASALAWLRAKGYGRVAIVSHSLGAAMVDAWLARQDAPPVQAWAPVGMLVPFTKPPQLPVQDVVAARDIPQALANAKRRAHQLPRDGCSMGITVDGTDHYFEGATTALADKVAAFLARVFAGGCAPPPARAARISS